MELLKFRGKGQIPQLGLKFRSPRKSVGATNRLQTGKLPSQTKLWDQDETTILGHETDLETKNMVLRPDPVTTFAYR